MPHSSGTIPQNTFQHRRLAEWPASNTISPRRIFVSGVTKKAMCYADWTRTLRITQAQHHLLYDCRRHTSSASLYQWQWCKQYHTACSAAAFIASPRVSGLAENAPTVRCHITNSSFCPHSIRVLYYNKQRWYMQVNCITTAAPCNGHVLFLTNEIKFSSCLKSCEKP